MSDMLRITATLNPKNYSMPDKPLEQSSTVFNISDLTKINKTNDRTEEHRMLDNSDADRTSFSSKLPIAKDPSFSSRLVRWLTSSDVSTLVNSKCSPDTINEYNEFVKNIFLEPKSISSDLSAQQSFSTSFNGPLFDMLRDISKDATTEVLNSITSFLQDTNSLQSQSDILNSLANNLLYLSNQLAPSKTLSEQLKNLALQFLDKNANLNFPSLKTQALELLNKASLSLIATDDTNSLISLVKYNLSRFCDNPQTLLDSFNSLLNLLDNSVDKQALMNAFEKFIQSADIPYPTKTGLLNYNSLYLEDDRLTFSLSNIADNNTKNITASALLEKLEGFASIDGSTAINLEQGSILLKNILGTFIHNNEDLNSFVSHFAETGDLNSLINRLSVILNSMSNKEASGIISNTLNNLLTAISKSSDITYTPPTSIQNLTDFLTKTLSNQNMKLLGLVDPDALVQSLLTAPGVYTPLLHYVIPVEIEDLRSFGELWIDPDDSDGKSSHNQNHMFLSFDIESVGLFELEIYNIDKKLSVYLYCPESLVKPFSKLTGKINNVVREAGYILSESDIKPLKKVRDITEVFPEINERRNGINVRI